VDQPEVILLDVDLTRRVRDDSVDPSASPKRVLRDIKDGAIDDIGCNAILGGRS